MKSISEVMTTDVHVVNPSDSIQEAARKMASADVGSLPVGDDDRLVGMITDRDIVTRAIAEGKDTNTPVREIMTEKIRYCYDDDDVEGVAKNMAELEVRRLPVVNRDKRLVGIVALSNITYHGSRSAAKNFLHGVAEPHQ